MFYSALVQQIGGKPFYDGVTCTQIEIGGETSERRIYLGGLLEDALAYFGFEGKIDSQIRRLFELAYKN